MLSPDYLEQAGEMTASVYRQIEAEMLEYLTQKLIEGDITGQRAQTAILMLAQNSALPLKQIIDSHKGEISTAVTKEVTDALKRSDKDDLARIKKGMGVTLPAITSTQMASTVKGIQEILARQNLAMAEGARSAFLQQATWAITQVNTGAMTTEKALHAAVRNLEREGISVISYRNAKTGRQTVKNKVDVAIRRHIRTQILQDGMRLTESRLDEAGVELVEVSSHSGSRPSHAKWEGRVYSRHGDKVIDGVKYKDFATACKVGDVADGIGGANCRHSYGPYFPGMPRSYEQNPEHPSGKSNEEVYELTQKQRYREREIRATKRELAGAEEIYKNDPSIENLGEVSRLKLKLRDQQAKMRDLIKDNPKVLQRSPRREWAGDMPKVKLPKVAKPAPKPKVAKLAPKPKAAKAAKPNRVRGRVANKVNTTAAKPPVPLAKPRINGTVTDMEKAAKQRMKALSTVSEGEQRAYYLAAEVTTGEHRILYSKKNGYIRTPSSYEINAAWRTDTPLDPKKQKTSDLLDDVINRFELEEEKAFLRMEELDKFAEPVLGHTVEELAKMSDAELYRELIGKDVTDKAFKSVSCDFNRNAFSTRDCICIIKNKKGTPIFFTDNVEESEAIFGRGVPAEITDLQVYNIRGEMDPVNTKNTVFRLILEITVGED